MDVVHERCAGLDVHKKTVVALVLRSAPKGVIEKEVRTFGTMTADLEALRAWLDECGCTHVAMEATGCTGSRSTTFWSKARTHPAGHQRPALEDRARSQNRRQRCRVDSRAAPSWPAARELHSGAAPA